MLNQLLGGRYRVVKVLGEGGLAKTYIVEDHHRPGHPQCVVKFLKPASNAPDFLPTAQRLFHQEAEILEKLGQHDRIPRSLAYFEENQEFYLVQELIEGHTLNQELLPGTPWSESQVFHMLTDVLPILEFVHSYGIIHRDIKPSNLIRRTKDNRFVLIDFGAVKQVSVVKMKNREPLTQNTISIGTKGYLPIEQVRGQPRMNSDIYALGMIAIRALTGIDPFYLRKDEKGEPIWLEKAEVGNDLAAIISKMVNYHFAERYQSATEVRQALQILDRKYTLEKAKNLMIVTTFRQKLDIGLWRMGSSFLIPRPNKFIPLIVTVLLIALGVTPFAKKRISFSEISSTVKHMGELELIPFLLGVRSTSEQFNQEETFLLPMNETPQTFIPSKSGEAISSVEVKPSLQSSNDRSLEKPLAEKLERVTQKSQSSKSIPDTQTLPVKLQRIPVEAKRRLTNTKKLKRRAKQQKQLRRHGKRKGKGKAKGKRKH